MTLRCVVPQGPRGGGGVQWPLYVFQLFEDVHFHVEAAHHRHDVYFRLATHRLQRCLEPVEKGDRIAAPRLEPAGAALEMRINPTDGQFIVDQPYAFLSVDTI